jgi:hypothetical protein
MINSDPTADMQAHDKAYASHPERKGSKPPAQAPIKMPDIAGPGYPAKPVQKGPPPNPDNMLNNPTRTLDSI